MKQTHPTPRSRRTSRTRKRSRRRKLSATEAAAVIDEFTATQAAPLWADSVLKRLDLALDEITDALAQRARSRASEAVDRFRALVREREDELEEIQTALWSPGEEGRRHADRLLGVAANLVWTEQSLIERLDQLVTASVSTTSDNSGPGRRAESDSRTLTFPERHTPQART